MDASIINCPHILSGNSKVHGSRSVATVPYLRKNGTCRYEQLFMPFSKNDQCSGFLRIAPSKVCWQWKMKNPTMPEQMNVHSSKDATPQLLRVWQQQQRANSNTELVRDSVYHERTVCSPQPPRSPPACCVRTT